MPKIIEYNPSSPKLSPNDRALQAWETAGRRVGPLYNQAAQDIKQAGAVKGEMEKAKIWPFDIYALEASTAPQIRNTTSTETRETKNDGPFVTGYSVSPSRGSSSYNSGSTQDADLAIQYANAGYDTTPESAANDWIAAHGEGSAGAVGMSRMARAAAKGHNLNPRFVRGGTVDLNSGNTFEGGHDDLVDTESGNIIGDHAARGDVSPNSNLPVNWHDMPYYNGKSLTTGPDGGQYTPHQMDIIAEQQANKEYTQAQRKQAIDDRYQRGVDKWNRQQAAADKADWMRFNGPNGFNTRRDQWLNGKGGLEDQWQKSYDADIQQRANDQIDAANKAGKDKDDYIRLRRNDPRVIDELRTYPNGRVQDAPPAQAPGGVINYLKNTLGSMFGSTLEDNSDNEDEY